MINSGASRVARVAAAAAVAVAVASVQTVAAIPAGASTHTGTVGATTQRMSAPTLKSTQHGTYPKGKRLTLSCYEHGQSVTGYYSRYIPGGWDNLWYRVSDGYWVADVDINTGSNNPITPRCTVHPSSRPPASTLNGRIVDRAKAVSEGARGGQCLPWVEGIIHAAGGPLIALGMNVNTYQAGWAQYATSVDWAHAKPGDVIQYYDPRGTYGPVHTMILMTGNSPATASVRDSNYGIPLNQELVHSGSFQSRSAGFHAGTYKIWRIRG